MNGPWIGPTFLCLHDDDDEAERSELLLDKFQVRVRGGEVTREERGDTGRDGETLHWFRRGVI